MKYMIISDIHGSYYYLKKAFEIFNEDKFDKMIILGDYLYHGPRNPFPEEYNPIKCVELMNQYKDKIIGIRGNCDADIDEELLEFDMQDNLVIENNGVKYLFTHGHKINENMPTNIECDGIVHGHFHIQKMYLKNGKFLISPGSISLPKNVSNYTIY